MSELRLKDPEAWANWQAKNKDPYGGACVAVARRVMELLEEAVAELEGRGVEPDVEPEILLAVEAFLPEDYVGDTGQRLVVSRECDLQISLAVPHHRLYAHHVRPPRQPRLRLLDGSTEPSSRAQAEGLAKVPSHQSNPHNTLGLNVLPHLFQRARRHQPPRLNDPDVRADLLDLGQNVGRDKDGLAHGLQLT